MTTYILPLARREAAQTVRTRFDYGVCTWCHASDNRATFQLEDGSFLTCRFRAIRPAVGRTFRIVYPAGGQPYADDWIRAPGET